MALELWKHAKAVEANYQQIAEVLLSKESESWKVEKLLALNLTPVPNVKPWYTIWSEGILAEALICFPEQVFPHLLEKLRTSDEKNRLFVIFKSLTMWGDYFAEALSGWLDVGAPHAGPLQQKSIYGLTLYAELLQSFCDSEDPTIEKKLQRENYSELALFIRDRQIGASPDSYLLGRPRSKLLWQLSQLINRDSDESQQIAVIRCLWKLYDKKSAGVITRGWLSTVSEKIEEAAKNAASRMLRMLEREAVVALCRIDSERSQEYIRQNWLQDLQRRSMAAEVLGIIRNEASLEMLRELVTDANPEARRKAISSIESFEPAQALAVLNSLKESNKEVHRQLIRSRSKLMQKLQKSPLSSNKKPQNAVYSISPLALLRLVPKKSIFSERELNESVKPEIIADVSSSRRYAVEVGLLDRRGDSYRLSEIGVVIHWVETCLKEGLNRFAESASGKVNNF